MLHLKEIIKKEVIDHFELIKSNIDIKAQRTLLEKYEKASNRNEREMANLIRANANLVERIDRVCDRSLDDINECSFVDRFDQARFNDLESIKKHVLKSYLVHFEYANLNEQTRELIKEDDLFGLGVLIEFDFYPNVNQLNFITNQLCDPEKSLVFDQLENMKETLQTYFQMNEFLKSYFAQSRVEKSSYYKFSSGDLERLEKITNLKIVCLECDRIESNCFVKYNHLTKLDLSSGRISCLRARSFSGLVNLKKLILSDCFIKYIESNSFSGLTVLEHLDLDNNDFSSLSSKCFTGLNNLRTLSLGGDYLKSLNKGVFNGLTSLEKLEISGLQLNSINSMVFNGLKNLKQLKLTLKSSCLIETKHVFSCLKKLTKCDLLFHDYSDSMGEKRRLIDVNFFENASNLNELNLSGCLIQNSLAQNLANLESLSLTACTVELKNQLFAEKMDRLRKLAFCGCKIAVNDTAVFEANYSNLESFESNSSSWLFVGSSSPFVYLNKLKSVHTDDEILMKKILSETNQTNIAQIELVNRYSCMVKLDSINLAKFSNLERLEINGYKIIELNLSHFNGFSNLKQLVLANCSISCVRSDGASNKCFESLELLDLSRNQLKKRHFNVNIFKRLTNLKSLDLSQNRWQRIDQAFFALFFKNNLKALFLNSCEISECEESSFSCFNQLEHLDLSDNNLQTIESSRVFHGLQNLKQLKINQCRLRSLNQHSLSCLSSTLSSLDLSNNPQLDSSKLFSALASLNSLMELNISNCNINSILSSDLSFASNLVELNISNNSIGYLAENVFHHTKKLAKFHMFNFGPHARFVQDFTQFEIQNRDAFNDSSYLTDYYY